LTKPRLFIQIVCPTSFLGDGYMKKLRICLFSAALFSCAPAIVSNPVITEEVFYPSEEPGSLPTEPKTESVLKSDIEALYALDLLLPVQDIEVSALTNSYSAARSGGRTHHAIDIMAPKITPVLATVDGTILKLHTNKLGGITIYETDESKSFIFYYAHLDHYETGLEEGKPVKRGDVIGYVGNTGNARGKAPHLHFSISKVLDPSKWWKGTSINPYYILTEKPYPGK
jgi:murein DD-endopeptidase MepM/ murein hydrolase activator NlpD